MSRFRLFVGGWNDGDPEWINNDVRHLTFDEARVQLAEELKSFENDFCEYCRSDAAQELARLLSSQPGQFEGNVDGDDYMIIPEMD